ncbi:MAG TPA: DEAD/DEAH box helicase [Oscillospiraceae bacterium]|nr:DEAD/DEAH box helicase [Oscillospiraceae bacterium]HPS34423.1 DEAD/DEAH box helicase [Oscillospiraceae bacterium]
MSFTQLQLCLQILKALEEQGYEAPSQIQEKAIPEVLSGRDILGCAQTGSGKTAAFALPILQLLWNRYGSANDHSKIRTLILTPTRELAIQIYDNFKAYGRHLSLHCGVVVGGVSQKQQEAVLARGVDILIATPGRLCDLMDQGIVSLNSVEIFVLDEADRMLDMGFIHDVRKISAKLRNERQTLMFSATMPAEVVKLVQSLLKDYVRIDISPETRTVETIEQRLYYVDTAHKKDLLLDILADENIRQALVFTRTKHGADLLTKQLVKDGVSALAIHGNKSQGARQNALKSFKDGSVRMLIATEIAARGIDIKELPYVFNYNIPEEAEMYIHRIGRTGRAGLGGIAISFCNYEELPLVQQTEKLLGKGIPVAANPKYPLTDMTVHKKGGRSGSPRNSTINTSSIGRVNVKSVTEKRSSSKPEEVIAKNNSLAGASAPNAHRYNHSRVRSYGKRR